MIYNKFVFFFWSFLLVKNFKDISFSSFEALVDILSDCTDSFLFLLDEQPSDNIKWFIVLGIVLVIIFNSFTYFVWDGVVNNSNLYDLFLKILISINI